MTLRLSVASLGIVAVLLGAYLSARWHSAAPVGIALVAVLVAGLASRTWLYPRRPVTLSTPTWMRRLAGRRGLAGACLIGYWLCIAAAVLSVIMLIDNRDAAWLDPLPFISAAIACDLGRKLASSRWRDPYQVYAQMGAAIAFLALGIVFMVLGI